MGTAPGTDTKPLPPPLLLIAPVALPVEERPRALAPVRPRVPMREEEADAEEARPSSVSRASRALYRSSFRHSGHTYSASKGSSAFLRALNMAHTWCTHPLHRPHITHGSATMSSLTRRSSRARIAAATMDCRLRGGCPPSDAAAADACAGRPPCTEEEDAASEEDEDDAAAAAAPRRDLGAPRSALPLPDLRVDGPADLLRCWPCAPSSAAADVGDGNLGTGKPTIRHSCSTGRPNCCIACMPFGFASSDDICACTSAPFAATKSRRIAMGSVGGEGGAGGASPAISN